MDIVESQSTMQQAIARGPFEANWEALKAYTVPNWYVDGKFGIFIHWGVYTVPAFDNEWYSRNMYVQDSLAFKHHVETYGPQTTFGYKDFIPMFKAEQFDADAWVALFKQAGAKFVVPVAEHHDGFAMYDCSFGNVLCGRCAAQFRSYPLARCAGAFCAAGAPGECGLLGAVVR